MKIVTYQQKNVVRVGRWEPAEHRIHPLSFADDKPIVDVLALIRSGVAPEALKSGPPLLETDVALLAPIPRPARNVFCVGKNYARHANEFTKSGFDAGSSHPSEAIPEHPIVFTKAPETVIANGEKIRYPHGVSESLDYEAELAVVIGKEGRGIKKADAMAHVYGYTIVNDVTARDWQKRHKQWFLGKSFDTFCPMGPCLVTADALDVTKLELRCWVNEELRQHAVLSDLIFDIPTLIETISAGITLLPGDVIATGTPEGVGIGFDPPRFLRPGDRVRIAIDEIGTLDNEVE
jgi:2-keto-4-pentenoate hydratase/2-oxohepta-3-ene-1,7-dioic acid hydratase in catechol pathway